ncbi:MAG: class I SAM-dependent methyltransferase [Chitinophagaceae bacterium]|nr:class I SAM-dependent methyltransferase [Chitinophagaceae bacterium]
MDALYYHSETVHNYSAPNEILPVILELIKPFSVLDVGCGIGTWLKIARDLGVKEVLGIDGSYVDKSLLKIPLENFIEKDLRNPFDLNKKFDLVICLEVAEHLPIESAEIFINSLCIHSDTILFSAAIPEQGGQNHLNEQWPSYWSAIFEKNGFRGFDVLRPVFWDNNNVQFWYKQNMILFSKNTIPYLHSATIPVQSYVHPYLYQNKLKEIKELKALVKKMSEKNISVGESFIQFLKALKQNFRKD